MMDYRDTQIALAGPFSPDEVEWKPQAVKNGRALAIAYADARVIMERLDAVMGVDGWADDYELLADGNVICRLSLRFGEQWVTKVDVGGESDQKDVGDKRKASFSDALKRAAVKWGVGRYLYSLPHQWVDYDEQKRAFKNTPRLPEWATPRKKGVGSNGHASAQRAEDEPGFPVNGAEFRKRLLARDNELTDAKKHQAGALLAFVQAEGEKGGVGPDLSKWSQAEIKAGYESAKVYERSLKEKLANEARRS